jgi:hypothetical protein
MRNLHDSHQEDDMPDLGGWADKAKDLAKEHPDQVDQNLEKAGDFADDRTGNKYTEQIDKGEDSAQQYLTGQRDQEQSNPDNS